MSLYASFSAANVFPAKLLRHERLIRSCIQNKRVVPVHVQLNPTNKCNFNCSFCSCSQRDKNLELPITRLAKIMGHAANLGCESVTITGGGEPLMYSAWDSMLSMLASFNIEVGLVTNGVLLKQRSASLNVKWCRVSSSDDLESQLVQIGLTKKNWLKNIEDTTKRNPHVDWAFSYVVSHNISDIEFIHQLIEFSNTHDFTHVRIVSDIFNSNQLVTQIRDIAHSMKHVFRVDDSHVVYQPRSEWTAGQNPCYISLLKPVVGADGFLYPCCGTQYALANPRRDYEREMRLGEAESLPKIVKEQRFFDGSVCSRCYYSDYNYALGVMLADVKHDKFV